MCGIAGQVAWDGRVTPLAVGRVIEALSHRGPDDQGVWCSDDGRVGLGHARLSIIDLSPLGHQPMHDPATGNVIVFNGEIYNFEDLRRECEALGDRFRSRSDTEVILALYRRLGVACLSRLRGMFAFALWDARRQELFVARDRVGKKPFVYQHDARGVTFASEVQALASAPGFDAAEDPEALELYLQMGYVPAPWTIYRSVRKLPAAHYAVFSRTGVRVVRYWSVDFTAKSVASDAEVLAGFEAHLTDAVRLRLIADVPVGALLSGGVDSSVVVAKMAALQDAPVKTYSIGFDQGEFDEQHHAAFVAQRLGTEHHPLQAHGDVADLIGRVAWHYGEPFADPSAVPSFMVSRLARDGVKVVLNGDGGDELLGGYPRYKIGRFARVSERLLGRLPSGASLLALTDQMDRRDSRFHNYAKRALVEQVAPALRALYIHGTNWRLPELAGLLGRPPAGVAARWRGALLDESRDHALSAFDRMLWLDSQTYLAGDLLPKMDIASMHCGLESRAPLLDHVLIEYCAALPTRHKLRGGINKHLLKLVARKHFPDRFVDRPKMGFGIPLASWLRGPLAAMVERSLSNPELIAPLRPDAVGRLRREFAVSDAAAMRVWSVLMLAMWREGARAKRAAVSPA